RPGSTALNCAGATSCRKRRCPTTNPFGMVYDSGHYHEAMEHVLALADWAGFPARRAEARERGKCRGIGVANYVDTATGAPRVKGTDRATGIFEVARAAIERTDLPEELRGKLRAESDETVNLAAFPYGCHVCEVEVDPDTGTPELVRYSAVDDVGRAVNAMIVHGQVHGGIVQGVGQAMWEQVVYDRESGQLLTGSFMDYAMPRADLVPFFTCELSEVPSPTHPLGIR